MIIFAITFCIAYIVDMADKCLTHLGFHKKRDEPNSVATAVFGSADATASPPPPFVFDFKTLSALVVIALMIVTSLAVARAVVDEDRGRDGGVALGGAARHAVGRCTPTCIVMVLTYAYHPWVVFPVFAICLLWFVLVSVLVASIIGSRREAMAYRFATAHVDRILEAMAARDGRHVNDMNAAREDVMMFMREVVLAGRLHVPNGNGGGNWGDNNGGVQAM